MTPVKSIYSRQEKPKPIDKRNVALAEAFLSLRREKTG